MSGSCRSCFRFTLTCWVVCQGSLPSAWVSRVASGALCGPARSRSLSAGHSGIRHYSWSSGTGDPSLAQPLQVAFSASDDIGRAHSGGGHPYPTRGCLFRAWERARPPSEPAVLLLSAGMAGQCPEACVRGPGPREVPHCSPRDCHRGVGSALPPSLLTSGELPVYLHSTVLQRLAGSW